jgi:hypothetical protein
MSDVLNRPHINSTKSNKNDPKEHKEEEKEGNRKGKEKEKKHEKNHHKDLSKYQHRYDHEMESHVTRKSNPTKSGMALPVSIMPVLSTTVGAVDFRFFLLKSHLRPTNLVGWLMSIT